MNISLREFLPSYRSSFNTSLLIRLVLASASIVITSQAYRIFMKSSDLLYALRISEDFFLIVIMLCVTALSRKVQLRNLAPFAILLIYSCLVSITENNLNFFRRYVIMMFWYIAAINAISLVNIRFIHASICIIGIFSAVAMIVDTERTIFSYLLEGNRMHAEGEGIDMNINNIALILTSYVTCASVIGKNITTNHVSKILVNTLFLSVAIVLLVASTRSALLFFTVILIYHFFKPSIKSLLFLAAVLVLSVIFLSPFYEQLVFIDRTVNQDILSSERIRSTIHSIKVFSESPVSGVGEARLLEGQITEVGSTDHNFYTKLLGSNGIIGFFAVMIFFCGLIGWNYKNLQGLFLLQGLFFYVYVFAPAGPGSVLIAATIFKLKENNRSGRGSPQL